MSTDAERIDTLIERTAELEAAVRATRAPSKAHVIGSGPGYDAPTETNFFGALAQARSRDYETQMVGKARLADMGSGWSDVDPSSKATVGDTNAAGGYIIPNAVVMEINLQATAARLVVDLFTNLNGVRGAAVQVPWEQETISRAVIALPGATKENSNFIVNAYTATLYTLARIFDVGNQLLRQSEGAAEQLVRSKLARAVGLGEDFYALNGTGTSQPYGLLTAIGTTGPYVTTFSSPSDSTLAGSVASAISKAAGDLEARGAQADGVAMNTTDWWEMRRQGTDTAGFFVDPAASVGQDLRLFGIPVRHSQSIPTDTLIVGQFKSALFFRGVGYRVDTSDQAGTRWDTNLTGFRGESEIAFDARPAVYSGHFQRVTNAVP